MRNSRVSVVLYPIYHRNFNQIAIKFEYNPELQNVCKRIGAKYSATHRCYYLTNNRENFSAIYKSFKDLAQINGDAFFKVKNQRKAQQKKAEEEVLTAEMLQQAEVRKSMNTNIPLPKETQVQLDAMLKFMQQSRMSENTINSYMPLAKVMLGALLPLKPHEINKSHIYQFNSEYLIAGNYSVAYQNQFISAIKLFFKVNYNQNIDLDEIERPIKAKELPSVLNKQQVLKLINVTDNPKHKALLATVYSCGLRIGEALNLKIHDLDAQRGVLKILGGKGKKDRVVPYPDSLKPLLRKYYNKYKPKMYLFESPSGAKYSRTAAVNILKSALGKAKITQKVTLHTLRHSYATHLLESGTDIRYIQELLGHNSPKTTMIYTHVTTQDLTKVKSPLDEMLQEPEPAYSSSYS